LHLVLACCNNQQNVHSLSPLFAHHPATLCCHCVICTALYQTYMSHLQLSVHQAQQQQVWQCSMRASPYDLQSHVLCCVFTLLPHRAVTVHRACCRVPLSC
jgi:hypothetical protein